jgi:hypothetical protein
MPTKAIEPITPTTARVSRSDLLNMRTPFLSAERPRVRRMVARPPRLRNRFQ